MGMQKPRDAHSGRIAFVVGFVVVAANIALLSPGDFLLSGLAGAGQQLFDRGRRDLLPRLLCVFPYGHIRDPNHLEQRLRFLWKAGKRPLPHEYVDARRLTGYEAADGGEYFAMAGPASAVVQVAEPLNRDFAALILKDGKAWAAQRQVCRQDAQALRHSHLSAPVHGPPHRRTWRAGWHG